MNLLNPSGTRSVFEQSNTFSNSESFFHLDNLNIHGRKKVFPTIKPYVEVGKNRFLPFIGEVSDLIDIVTENGHETRVHILNEAVRISHYVNTSGNISLCPPMGKLFGKM